MKVRYSFSLLKLMQSIILGTGAGMLIFVTWKTSTAELLAGRKSVTRVMLVGGLELN